MISREAPNAAIGIAAAQGLGDHGDVGLDAVVLLRPAGGHAQAGDHLVEDQQRAVIARSASRTPSR